MGVGQWQSTRHARRDSGELEGTICFDTVMDLLLLILPE
jgi:hypothetical protein